MAQKQDPIDHKIMEFNPYQRVAEDDPRRCQYNGIQGQCILISVPTGQNCIAHGGAKQLQNIKDKELRNYRLAKFKSRTAELGNSDHISSLRDEVAILRMLIEEKINHCDGVDELLLVSGPLSDLIMKVERVISSMEKLDHRLGNLLTKEKVIQFAQCVVEIVSTSVSDETELNIISSKILKALESL